MLFDMSKYLELDHSGLRKACRPGMIVLKYSERVEEEK